MGSVTKEYSNGAITVVWKPDACIHSTLCFNGLKDVFNPKARPWVNIGGATTEQIIAQVDKCPSGALSYYKNESNETGGKNTDVETIVETMPNGPLMVYGNITVKDRQGNEVKKNKVTAFCRCGASANKPYCDGSHVRTGFKDE